MCSGNFSVASPCSCDLDGVSRLSRAFSKLRNWAGDRAGAKKLQSGRWWIPGAGPPPIQEIGHLSTHNPGQSRINKDALLGDLFTCPLNRDMRSCSMFWTHPINRENLNSSYRQDTFQPTCHLSHLLLFGREPDWLMEAPDRFQRSSSLVLQEWKGGDREGGRSTQMLRCGRPRNDIKLGAGS